MLDKQYELKHLLNANGEIACTQEELAKNEALALEVMEYFLGCSIFVNGKEFILSSLELYYGSIGDMAHDWYRSMYPEKYTKKSKHSKGNTSAQISAGPIYYFNQKGEGRFKRCDIVVGRDEVAVSFLIRNVLDCNLKPLGNKMGQPNVVLNKMGLTDAHHMQAVEIKDNKDRIIEKPFKITKKMRVISGKATGFNNGCIHDKKLWNLSLE